jgi:hypothetical protein
MQQSYRNGANERVQEADQADKEAIFAGLGIDDVRYEDQLNSDNSDSNCLFGFISVFMELGRGTRAEGLVRSP